MMDLKNIDTNKLKEILHKHLQRKNFGELYDMGQMLIAENIEPALVNYYLGEVCLQQNKLKNAKEFFSKALKYDDNNASLLEKLAIIASKEQDYIIAKKYFIKATQQAPNNPNIVFNYAIFLSQLKQYPQAIEYTEKAIKFDSENIRIRSFLANLYYLIQDYKKSLLNFEILYFQDRSVTNLRQIIELYNLTNNNSEKLLLYYKQLSKTKEFYLADLEIYVNLLVLHNKSQEALKLCDIGLKKDKTIISLNFLKAKILYMIESYDESKEIFKYLLKLEPDNDEIKRILNSFKSDLPDIDVHIGSDITRKFNGSWYRGENTNFLPSKKNLKEDNAIKDYILKGWLPNEPFIDKKMKITTFGSCFAANVTQYLKLKGYNVLGNDLHINSHIVRFGEGMVNSYAILQQFEWAYENKNFSEDLWHNSNKEIASYNEEIRKNTKYIFDNTEVFIITLGLSEIWYNKKTLEVFWRAIPKEQFNPEIHGFRVATHKENTDNLHKLYSLIKKYKPNAYIIFTLSPVPLNATFRDVSCLTANSVSKSILRSALDEFTSNNSTDKKLFYFPSYEIVKDYYIDPYIEDNRHVSQEVIVNIMSQFEKNYCIK